MTTCPGGGAVAFTVSEHKVWMTLKIPILIHNIIIAKMVEKIEAAIWNENSTMTKQLS